MGQSYSTYTADDVAYHKTWKPASGHSGGWRVIRYPSANQWQLGRMEEYSDVRGRPRLYKTHEAAKRVADKLNAEIVMYWRNKTTQGAL